MASSHGKSPLFCGRKTKKTAILSISHLYSARGSSIPRPPYPLRILHSACIESCTHDDDDDVTPKVLTDDRTNDRSPPAVTRNSARARQMCQLPSAGARATLAMPPHAKPPPPSDRMAFFSRVRVCPFPRHFSSRRDLCICLRNSQCMQLHGSLPPTT